MHVTVAICTWNRAALLDQTLRQMQHLVIPPSVRWELIVVNNNCSDTTDSVLSKYATVLPLVRLFEQRQGHCFARNCAVRAAQGELLLWTDDDVLVDRNWLAAYVQAAEHWPQADFFGGTIDPWFEREPPAWFKRHWKITRQPYVIRQYGDETRPLAPQESPAGANMAFRTETLRAFPFDERLGRVGDLLAGGDDDDVVDRMRRAGRLGIWVGGARVQHFLPADRLSRSYLRRWYFGAGITQVRKNGKQPVPTIFGVPRWALREYAIARAKLLMLEPVRNAAWIETFRRVHILEGYLWAHLQKNGTWNE